MGTCMNSFSAELSVFATLSVILLWLSQKESSLRSLLTNLLISFMVSLMFWRSVLSAKWNEEENLIELWKLFICKWNSRGPRIDPYGTPKLTSSRSEEIAPIKHIAVIATPLIP